MDLLPPLLQGLKTTVLLTVAGGALAMLLALIAGLGRLHRHVVVRGVARCYIEVFRGTSALVQLFWFYFVLPFFGVNLNAMTVGIVVLGLNGGAYGAEVVRGAIRSVAKEQHEAALALNFTPRQTIRYVVLPQAVVAMLPPLGNILIELLKASALVSLITISELTFVGQTLRSTTLRTAEIFGLVMVLYFAVALCLTGGVRLLEHHWGRYR